MSKFEKILYWYRAKMWDIKKVRNAVVKNWITEDEFKKIIGDDY